ncbi:MAG: ABC transporter permease [Spirochaetales bacterium]|nr:ABC transporter permease [Spirochaetales bacterium]
MKYLALAVRNLNRQKKRSVLLGGAIALGILVITLVNGFTAGAVTNVKDNFAYLLAGHVYISEETKRDDDTEVSLFTHPELLDAAIAEVGLDPRAVIRRSTFMGTFLFHGKNASQQVQGVQWDREDALRQRLILTAGSVDEAMADPRGIILSQQAADLLGVAIGEEITVRLSTVTGQQNVGTFVVRATMADPGILGNLSAYAALDRVNELVNIPAGTYQTVSITLDSMTQVEPVTTALYEALGRLAQVKPRDETPQGLQVNTEMSFIFQEEPEDPWTGSRFTVANINEFTAQLESLSTLVNSVGLSILMVLILITLVGVANTFRMIMYERVKEIGTMRALGMQRPAIRRIFLYEATSLAILGYLAGVLLAGVVGLLIGFFQIPSDNAFSLFAAAGRLTFPYQVPSLVGNLILITGLTALAALVPANKAAKLQPADALRA